MDKYIFLGIIGIVVTIIVGFIGIYWKNLTKFYQNPIISTKPEHIKGKFILIVGSGVIENVFIIDKPIEYGNKYLIKKNTFIGGSAINYSCRLLKMGFLPLPIISIGDDIHGKKIKEELIKEISSVQNNQSINQLKDFLNDDILCKGYITSESTILVNNSGERTIFSNKIELAQAKRLKKHIINKLNQIIFNKNFEIAGVIIGHIYGDDFFKGEITKKIIDIVKQEINCPIYANFGSSQLQFGFQFWKNYLKNIDVFQLSLNEARNFFKASNISNSLVDIVNKIREEYSFIITMDKIGAIGIIKDEKSLIAGWPYILNGHNKDSTGSGDAFGAGMFVNLLLNRFSNYLSAIKEAIKWAAYACKYYGGANNCPNNIELDAHISHLKQFETISQLPLHEEKFILSLIDRLY